VGLRQRGYRRKSRSAVFEDPEEHWETLVGITPCGIEPCTGDYAGARSSSGETTADPNSAASARRDRRRGYVAELTGDAPTRNQRGVDPLDSGNIKALFDRIRWRNPRHVIWTSIPAWMAQAGFMERQQNRRRWAGHHRGGIVSAESPCESGPRRLGWLQQLPESNARGAYSGELVRYADDFIITGRNRDLLETEVKPAGGLTFLAEQMLEALHQKTRIPSHIEEVYDSWGRDVRKYRGKLLIKPAKANVRAFLAKVPPDHQDE